MNDGQFKYLEGVIAASTFMIISYILLISAMMSAEPHLTALLSIGGLLTLTYTFAVVSDGYSRRVWGRVVTFEEPPLEDRKPYEGDAL